MAMNPTNGMAAGQPGTGNPFAGRSGQVPAAQDVQGRQAPREEQAAQPIGPKQLSEATRVLLKYKSGKAALDRRIVENEHWYRLHRDTEDGNFADSGWMFNSLANKHADAMDNYPEPNVLPRAQVVQGRGHPLVGRDDVHVRAAVGDLGRRDRRVPAPAVVVPAPALVDGQVRQHVRVGHPAPAQRAVAGRIRRLAAEAVVLAAEHAGFDAETGQRRQCVAVLVETPQG